MHPIDLAIIASISSSWLPSARGVQEGRAERRVLLPRRQEPAVVGLGVAHGSSGIDITDDVVRDDAASFMRQGHLAALGVAIVQRRFPDDVPRHVGAPVELLTGASGCAHVRGRRRRELAYLSVVLYALVSVVGFLSYAFQGIGKFAQPFFPGISHRKPTPP